MARPAQVERFTRCQRSHASNGVGQKGVGAIPQESSSIRHDRHSRPSQTRRSPRWRRPPSHQGHHKCPEQHACHEMSRGVRTNALSCDRETDAVPSTPPSQSHHHHQALVDRSRRGRTTGHLLTLSTQRSSASRRLLGARSACPPPPGAVRAFSGSCTPVGHVVPPQWP